MKQLELLESIFRKYPEIKLVYLFGSQATGNIGPLSDFDFAVYFDGLTRKQMGDQQLKLIAELTGALKTDKIDFVVLNLANSPELKYHIISEGKLIYSKEPYKVIVEPSLLNEYFDFYYSLKKYGLTKA